MIPEISVQLFSLREELSSDYDATIRAVSAMGFGNVEPAGYPGTSLSEAMKLFQELGLKVPSCHGQLPIGDNRNQIIEDALALGCRYIFTGVPENWQENYKSHDTVKAMSERYCEAAENAAPHGIQVGYHNHDWDLVTIEGKPGYRTFLENTPDSVLWEADLFWAARAGLDMVDFVREIGSRGKVIHFKDGDVSGKGDFRDLENEDGKFMVSSETPFLPAGRGEVDLKAAFAAADYLEYAVVEIDSYPGDMLEAIHESYTYLTTAGIATGRV